MDEEKIETPEEEVIEEAEVEEVEKVSELTPDGE